MQVFGRDPGLLMPGTGRTRAPASRGAAVVRNHQALEAVEVLEAAQELADLVVPPGLDHQLVVLRDALLHGCEGFRVVRQVKRAVQVKWHALRRLLEAVSSSHQHCMHIVVTTIVSAAIAAT